jgi:hypothetical protein
LLGGQPHCFSIEKKTRIFVDAVLMFVCSQLNNNSEEPTVYVDMEVELEVFNQMVKPDYQIMRRCRATPVPLYVIEVKRTYGNKQHLLRELDQHFKQLRYICIQNKLGSVYGVITDYKDWYFTMYSLEGEIA